MLARVEHFFRRLRRFLSRSEWAIPLLGLPVSKGTSTAPGLILIQIDGLSRHQMETAMQHGRMPFLGRLIQREHYEARTFYSGLPSSTPAVQGELFYGKRCAVPAFTFFDRFTRRFAKMIRPGSAKKIEAQLEKCGEGLLRQGSSWSNVFAGGAAEEETHFCAVGLGLRDLLRKRPVVRVLTFPLVHFPSLVKILVLLMVEFWIALWDLLHGIFRGESLHEEIIAVFKRVFICIGLRELLTIGVKIDAARGLPIVHVNYLGYDEQAHRRGPSSAFAHWSLRGIDRAIRDIYESAQRSGRRDYQVWVFSDHGQEATQIYHDHADASLEELVSAALESVKAHPSGNAPRNTPGTVSGSPSEAGATARPLGDWLRAEVLARFEHKDFTIAAFGPVGHIYLKHPQTLAVKRQVAAFLLREGGVPGALLCRDAEVVEWIFPGGQVLLPSTSLAFLPHPATIRQELSKDMAALCRHELAGDIILLGWGPNRPAVSYVAERGSHAGPGPEETQGFLLLPALTRLPDPSAKFLRPSDLRAAILHLLGRQRLPAPTLAPVRSPARPLRVMTYNVHSCLGMDGRISPHRIATVIARHHPHLVALQELDLGRVRTQHHDQPRLIAEELDMHLAFCPTVIAHGEQYGHAVLSVFPLKVLRTDILESGKQPSRVEPRGALWVAFELNGVWLNLMNTHFGLRRSERLAQAGDLLSPGWIGAVKANEPLILCGDFNMFPRGEPYRSLTHRLRDVQADTTRAPALNTFSTIHPLVRIDHIFISMHFQPRNVLVPRNHLTRVASDHLPLMVELDFSELGVTERSAT